MKSYLALISLVLIGCGNNESSSKAQATATAVAPPPSNKMCADEMMVDMKHQTCAKAASTTSRNGQIRQGYDCDYQGQKKTIEYIVEDGKLCKLSIGQRIADKYVPK
jgi:hypothetical protein